MKVIIEDVNGHTKRIIYFNIPKYEPEDIDAGDYREMLEQIEMEIDFVLNDAKYVTEEEI